MRYLTKILFVIGLIIAFCAVGNAEIDIAFPLWKTILIALGGFALMLPAIIKLVKEQVIE